MQQTLLDENECQGLSQEHGKPQRGDVVHIAAVMQLVLPQSPATLSVWTDLTRLASEKHLWCRPS